MDRYYCPIKITAMKIETLRTQDKVTLTVGTEEVEFTIERSDKIITVNKMPVDTSGDIKLTGYTSSGQVITSGIIAGQNGLDLFIRMLSESPVNMKTTTKNEEVHRNR